MNNKKAKRIRKAMKTQFEKVASTAARKEYQELKEMYKNGDIILNK